MFISEKHSVGNTAKGLSLYGILSGNAVEHTFINNKSTQYFAYSIWFKQRWALARINWVKGEEFSNVMSVYTLK